MQQYRYGTSGLSERNTLTTSIISQMTMEACEGTVVKLVSLLPVQLFLNELQPHME